MKNKHYFEGIIFVFLFCSMNLSSYAQEGLYAGFGWNTYSAREQITSSDGQFQFSHSTNSSSNGFLTQSLGNYGLGFYVGYRKDFNKKDHKNIFTLETQYCYNFQNVKLESSFSNLKVSTKANYNHGFRFSIGHRFKKIHPYLIIQAHFQTVTPSNNAINSGGIIYDVDDDGNILTSKLDEDGNDFSTEVFSFLGAFGIEVPLKEKMTLHVEYVPMKHVEYGIRDINEESLHFIHNLVVNQLQVGLRFYLFDPN